MDLVVTILAELGAIVVLIAIVLFFTRVVLPGWRQQRLRTRARRWPKMAAQLDHACVTEYRPSDTLITFRLDAWFTYTVNGKQYEGTYSDEDMRLDDAKVLLRHLNHEPVIITYNPRKPGEYFYRPPRLKKSA